MANCLSEEKRKLSQEIANKFENGKTIEELTKIYAEPYQNLYHSTLRVGMVQKIVTTLCSDEFLSEYNGRISGQIVEYRKDGMTFEDIAKIMGFSIYKVSSLYHATNSDIKANNHEKEGIRPEEINYLKENIKEGDSIKMMVKSYYKDESCREHCRLKRGFVKIIRKYPNFAETSEGCLTWGQIAIFIHDERKAI